MARTLLALPLAVLLLAACSGSRAQGPRSGEELIVFVSSRDGDEEIYVMRPDGSNVRQLTRNSLPVEREPVDDQPAWSPDGTKIAFGSQRDHPPSTPDDISREELYVMNADGSDQRRLTKNESLEFAPDWAPDGRIVFAGCDGDFRSCEIETMNGDGSERRKVTDNAKPDFDPAWSRDGRWIAFVRMEGHSHDQHFEIYVVNADGSGERRLTRNRVFDGGPQWSPDGRKLLFASNRAPSARCIGHDCVGFTSELYVMKTDGTNVKRLTHHPADDGGATWSADGKRIVFARIRDYNEDDHELYLMNADGGCETRITANRTEEHSPDWFGGRGALRCVDLAVSARFTSLYTDVGRRLLARVDVRNLGTLPARRASIRVPVPPTTRLIEASASHGRCAGRRVLTCSFELAPTKLLSIRIVLRATVGRRLVLTGTASSGARDPDQHNDRGSATTLVCTLRGTAKSDTLLGTPGPDVICAGAGDDAVRADGGDDVVYGEDGNDVLLAGSGGDVVRGGAGEDRIVGGRGRDRLYGGAGCDMIDARDGERDFFAGDQRDDQRLVKSDRRDWGSLSSCP